MKEYKDGLQLKRTDQATMALIPRAIRLTGHIPDHGNNERYPFWRMLVGQCFDLPYSRRKELKRLINYMIRYQNQTALLYNEAKLFHYELIRYKTPVYRFTRLR